MLRIMLVIGMVALPIAPASAYCSAPSSPDCANSYSDFDDQDEFDSCRSEMEDYQNDVETFLMCQNGEIDDHTNEIENLRSEGERVRSEYNDAVSGFNNRAQ